MHFTNSDCERGRWGSGFGYEGTNVVGLYLGRKIDTIITANALFNQLIDRVQNQGLGDTLVSQVCGPDWDGEHTIGLIASSNDDFGFIQQAIQS